MVFIKVTWLINVNVSLEAILEGQGGGGKQHCLILFVGLNLGVETFLKKMEHQKRLRYYRGLRHLCILGTEVSRKFYVKSVCFLIVFLVIKGILKALFSFIP